MDIKTWEIKVREARGFIVNYEQNRFKIAQLAMDVCDNSHGGRKNGMFTLARFARAIDLNSKTLYTWVALKKRVIDKLPVKTDIKNIPLNILERVNGRVGPDTTPRQVSIFLSEESESDPNKAKWLKYTRTLKSILHNANTPIKLMEIEAHVLDEIIKLTKTIAAMMGKELEFRSRGESGAKVAAQKQIDKFDGGVRAIKTAFKTV